MKTTEDISAATRRLLTIQEFAERYAFSEKTARRYIQRRMVSYVRIGKIIRFREADICAFEARFARDAR